MLGERPYTWEDIKNASLDELTFLVEHSRVFSETTIVRATQELLNRERA